MEYTELALEFMNHMLAMRKFRPQKLISHAMQGESFVLHFISLQGGEALPGEIGAEMEVSSARIAAALNSLESKGLITREIDRNDRRKILVRITKEGRELADKHMQGLINDTANLLEHLGEHDAREMTRIMGRLREFIPENKQCGKP